MRRCGVLCAAQSFDGRLQKAEMLREPEWKQIEHGSQAAHRPVGRRLGCDRIRLLQRQGIECRRNSEDKHFDSSITVPAKALPVRAV